ncbi:GntR family transcriptional regulator [Microcella putealis]|uniref:GntR family transcriptional regulator n=1 Tax=Microcella putealis TaxID=337005 RepID=A0A4Q7LQ81_9MICO|nr:PLP-dependent aminotransferase family protein [Microcella putealis]RZS56088.1 GntR family transcriptional regulator [Microcella putealis]TQM23481.1 GntR family transcriptional regulator [Microcella putealis]
MSTTVLSARALSVLLGDWRHHSGTLAQALADRVRLLVLDGRIALGARLPAERQLADHEGVSRTTVAAAYARLRELGYLVSRRGSGSVTALPAGDAPAFDVVDRPDMLDFSKATLPALPAVVDAAAAAVARLPQHLGLAGFDLYGLDEVRQAIADRFTARGLPTSADEIMVTLGAQRAIALIAQALVGRGDRVLVENPSYPHALEAFSSAGARLVGVPVSTEHGWDDEAFEQLLPRSAPCLAYLMPDLHNPTSATMPAAQRERVAALADRHGTRIVVDETMVDLAFDPATVQVPMASCSPRIITVGSVGKSIWGGIRLGWIRADRETIGELARARPAGDLGSPTLEQLLLSELLQRFDGLVAERTAQLRAGEQLLRALLSERFPEWRLPEVDGGLVLWTNLGRPVASEFALLARAEGVQLGAGPRFSIDGAFERYLRLPFCYPETLTRRAVDAMERAWERLGPARADVPDDDALVTTVV